MRLRRLGKTELMVSEIGFGGIPIQRVTQEETNAIIKACHEAGVRFIDTARGYTNSEELLGNALKGLRQDFILATKTMSRDYEGMKKDIDTSLRLLQTDYIDLYQCHNIRTQEQYDLLMNTGGYRALQEAKAEGKIRHIGVTSHSADFLMTIVDKGEFETVQFPYNLIETQATTLFDRCHALDMGVIAMKPAAGGALPDVSLSLKFILNHPAMTVAIPGMDSVEQVGLNAAVGCNALEIRADEQAAIDELRATMGNKFCRRCGYCLPCPEGIDIPSQFLFEGYLSRYNLPEWSYGRYEAQAKNASHCVQCGVCETRCPYDLPIRDMLKNVVEKMKR